MHRNRLQRSNKLHLLTNHLLHNLLVQLNLVLDPQTPFLLGVVVLQWLQRSEHSARETEGVGVLLLTLVPLQHVSLFERCVWQRGLRSCKMGNGSVVHGGEEGAHLGVEGDARGEGARLAEGTRVVIFEVAIVRE
jgi:ABC-type uncharacterized transport system YnjBCD permease subunit